jgi:hypothetical protein
MSQVFVSIVVLRIKAGNPCLVHHMGKVSGTRKREL